MVSVWCPCVVRVVSVSVVSVWCLWWGGVVVLIPLTGDSSSLALQGNQLINQSNRRLHLQLIRTT